MNISGIFKPRQYISLFIQLHLSTANFHDANSSFNIILTNDGNLAILYFRSMNLHLKWLLNIYMYYNRSRRAVLHYSLFPRLRCKHVVREPAIGLIMWLRPKGLKVCSYVEKYAEFKNQTLIKIRWYINWLYAKEYPRGDPYH